MSNLAIDIIIVPQGAEYQAVKKGLNKLATPQPLIVAIPIGVNQIKANLTYQKFGQFKPKKVLIMGLCGSLSSEYAVGNAVLYQNCYEQTTQKNIATSQNLNQLISKKLLAQNNFNHYLVSGLTSDRVISTITKKKQLAHHFTTKVVDMESFAYLNLFQQTEIEATVLRVVSDDLKYNLPNLNQAISEQGNIKPVAMTKAMLKQPITSLRFIRASLKGLQKLQQITNTLFQK